jgi:hypothetical protein
MASVVLKPNADGSTGLQGGDRDNGGFINVNIEYNASSVDKWAFVATRAYVVQGISGVPAVAGSDGSAVTASVVKASGTTAITSGTALHSGTYNLKGTANTVQSLTLSTTSGVTALAAGDRIGIDFTGTLTAATGVITVCLAPA